MLLPRPDTIRTLLARYYELQLEHSQDSHYELQRSLEDVTYTLCVSTGTRTVQDALLAAEAILRSSTTDQRPALQIPGQRSTPPGSASHPFAP
ncbi:DUF5133 domain-containing protein [Streptomyces sp. NPDC101178]|uniref:DUF5133 domain-containing protein n=1 Tax=Streptomyces sp. NPDC101178 TaxID=3366124 RepID=UPI00380B660F